MILFLLLLFFETGFLKLIRSVLQVAMLKQGQTWADEVSKFQPLEVTQNSESVTPLTHLMFVCFRPGRRFLMTWLTKVDPSYILNMELSEYVPHGFFECSEAFAVILFGSILCEYLCPPDFGIDEDARWKPYMVAACLWKQAFLQKRGGYTFLVVVTKNRYFKTQIWHKIGHKDPKSSGVLLPRQIALCSA